jgi:hypothetical protein
MIISGPWCVPNTVILKDFQIPTVEEEIITTALSTVRASEYTQTAY